MSYEYDEDFFIEDKIEYGLSRIINERIGNEYIQNNRYYKIISIIEIIAGLNNTEDVFEAIVRYEYNSNMEMMIKYYAKKEQLPIEFVNVAKSKNAISILIKSYLQKNGFILSESLINEINELIETLEYNIFESIVYERVEAVQKFIHTKIQEKNTKGSHENLNKDEMKNILSSVRLYLNIQDIKNKNINQIINALNKNDEAIQEEYNNPTLIDLSKEKKFIPIWKARNMRLLSDYLPSVEKKQLNIIDIDKDLSLKNYKNEIVSCYM